LTAYGRRLTVRALCTVVCALCACDKPAPRPDREFLLVTADSTFWVTASGSEMKARGVPMLVARIDGRFTELYVTDDDRSYYDAVFIGHRLFARDLQRGDSLELHRDTLVSRLAAEYAKAHPGDQPLSPDEPENDNASIRATSDIEILGIHGAYLSYEHHTDVDTRDENSSDHRHQYRRGVLDARTGKPALLAQLFGEDAATAAAGDAQREWSAAKDSLIARAGTGAARARRAISDFSFDRESFAIGSDGQSATVRFAPPARGTNPDIEPIELQSKRVASPAWWAEAAAELPLAPGDTGRWAHGGDTLVVGLASGPRAWTVTLKSGASSHFAARVSSAVERVIWLDSTVSDADRAALVRAFDEAGSYDGQRQVAGGEMAPDRSSVHLGRHDPINGRAFSPRLEARVIGADDARGRECARPRLRRLDSRHARQDGGCLRDAALAHALRHGIG
jgi:hypothetical protein